MSVPTAEPWIVELLHCSFTHNEGRFDELYRQHVKGPAEVERIVAFAGRLAGLSRQELAAKMEAIVRRHTH